MAKEEKQSESGSSSTQQQLQQPLLQGNDCAINVDTSNVFILSRDLLVALATVGIGQWYRGFNSLASTPNTRLDDKDGDENTHQQQKSAQPASGATMALSTLIAHANTEYTPVIIAGHTFQITPDTHGLVLSTSSFATQEQYNSLIDYCGKKHLPTFRSAANALKSIKTQLSGTTLQSQAKGAPTSWQALLSALPAAIEIFVVLAAFKTLIAMTEEGLGAKAHFSPIDFGSFTCSCLVLLAFKFIQTSANLNVNTGLGGWFIKSPSPWAQAALKGSIGFMPIKEMATDSTALLLANQIDGINKKLQVPNSMTYGIIGFLVVSRGIKILFADGLGKTYVNAGHRLRQREPNRCTHAMAFLTNILFERPMALLMLATYAMAAMNTPHVIMAYSGRDQDGARLPLCSGETNRNNATNASGAYYPGTGPHLQPGSTPQNHYGYVIAAFSMVVLGAGEYSLLKAQQLMWFTPVRKYLWPELPIERSDKKNLGQTWLSCQTTNRRGPIDKSYQLIVSAMARPFTKKNPIDAKLTLLQTLKAAFRGMLFLAVGLSLFTLFAYGRTDVCAIEEDNLFAHIALALIEVIMTMGGFINGWVEFKEAKWDVALELTSCHQPHALDFFTHPTGEHLLLEYLKTPSTHSAYKNRLLDAFSQRDNLYLAAQGLYHNLTADHTSLSGKDFFQKVRQHVHQNCTTDATINDDDITQAISKTLGIDDSSYDASRLIMPLVELYKRHDELQHNIGRLSLAVVRNQLPQPEGSCGIMSWFPRPAIPQHTPFEDRQKRPH